MVDPDTKAWVQVWNAEPYEELEQYTDELWDSPWKSDCSLMKE
jgi:hypothetical protein